MRGRYGLLREGIALLQPFVECGDIRRTHPAGIVTMLAHPLMHSQHQLVG